MKIRGATIFQVLKTAVEAAVIFRKRGYVILPDPNRPHLCRTVRIYYPTAFFRFFAFGNIVYRALHPGRIS